jgi:hypothetical protein
VDDLDDAWEEFASMRSEYEPRVLGMCQLILPPPAPWSSDLLERPRRPIPRRRLD